MRGTPSWSTTSACFPISRKTWQQARADPTASPSGRACDVSTNRSCCPICRSTSSSMLLGLISTGFLAGFASSFFPLQQFLDPGFRLFGAIQAKIELGGSPDPQPLYQLVTDIFASRFQPFYTPIGFRVIALHIDPNLGGSSIVCDVDRGHAHQADARIS